MQRTSASSDGLALPGVTITVTSESLQGERGTTTSEFGEYLIPMLPPGHYTITVTLDGFQTVQRTQDIAGTQRRDCCRSKELHRPG